MSTTAKAQPPAQSTAPRGLPILTAVTALAVAIGFALAFVIVGPDAVQGDVQRLFYIHLPSFFGAFFGFGAAVIGGVMYLRTRATKWDTLALAGVEVGLGLALVNLITGSIWAYPIWNTWWTWDPRLTSAAIMALTYAAYLMLRAGFENPDKRRRIAAVYGIVAISTVILTLMIIRIVPETIHPVVIGPSPTNAEGTFEADTNTALALLPNLVIWGVLVPLTLMWHRIRLQNFYDLVQTRKANLMEGQ
jgi:heme exporter protein C